ncbi:carboxypeptidase T [Nonlabens dokdonensis DSW-6]|uniref:Carboxypeptidase T n=2 Tax=Nonlabens dokdonensis TaxID=328515 RepID=L7W9B9_NONDD|nr:carboxypeptidase T [Nonlabens dokdonensis DSW-6]
MVLLVAFVSLAQTANPGDIVITEIMIDPNSSSEQDREWFEVYNTTSSPIDMNGWTIGDNSSSSRDHVIASMSPVIVPANGYAVFVYNDDTAENAGITNAIYAYGAGTGNSNSGFPTWNNESTYSGMPPNSTTADGPELFDTMGTLIDEIEYGFGYSGLNAWPAQGAASATSYQLDANTLDGASNDVAANWIPSTSIYGSFNGSDYFGTPSTANIAGGGTPAVAAGDIVITEIMIDPNGTETNEEWFEVYNTTGSDIDINGWTINDESSNGRAHVISSMTPVLVPANSYAVLVSNGDSAANGGITNAIYDYGYNSPVGGTPTPGVGTNFPTWNNESTYAGGSTNDDGIRLETPSGTVIDQILYGFGYSDGSGGTMNAWPAMGAASDVSYQLDAAVLDSVSNDNAMNWIPSTATYGTDGMIGTPGTANFNSATAVLVGDIIITELMIDPDGSEADTEWFEVYNTTGSSINMQNWTIIDVSSSGRNHVIASAAIVPANSYAILATNSVTADNGGLPAVLYSYGVGTSFPRFNNESSFGSPDRDGVALQTAAGLEIDRVEYDYETDGIGFPAAGTSGGASQELGFSFFNATANDNAEAWSAGISTYGDDEGTPAAANDFNRVYTYNNGWLAPFNDVNGNTNDTADLVVLSGVASVSSTTASQSVTVESNGSLSISAGIVMSVKKNMLVNGNIEANGATLLLNGNAAQTISGTGVVNVGTLDIDNSSDVNNSATFNLFNELNLSNGNLNNSGTFTFKNTSSGTAVVNELPVALNVTGDYSVERYIPVATSVDGRVYRFLSSPVTTTTSIYNNWQASGANVAGQGIHITGTAGAPGVDMATGFDRTVSGATSAFTYSNATSQTWNAIASTNQTGDVLSPLNAYRVFVRGDRDPARLTSALQANATTLTTTGTLNQGSLPDSNYDVESGDFVFIGNPFQAAVDMESVLANSDNVNNNVIYYWDPSLGGMSGRGAYTAVSGFASGGTATSLPSSPNSEFIQPGQAAFLVANSGANGAGNDMIIRFRESDKGTSSNLSSSSVFSVNNNFTDQVVITLFDTPSYLANSSATDAVMLKVDPTFSDLNDDNDFLKPTNLDETLAIIGTNSREYGVQSISQVQDGTIIPLGIRNYGDQNYTFKIDVTGFAGYNVYMVDNFLNTSTALTTSSINEVTFSVSSGNGSDLQGRFSLEFENAVLSLEENFANQVKMFPNPSKGGEVLISASVPELSIQVFNALGQRIMIKELNTTLNSFDTSGWKSGMYIVKISSANDATSLKLMIN